MINSDTDTRTLPPEVQAHRPHPLGADAQHEAERSGSSIHEAADLLAVRETPTEDLPAWLAAESKRAKAAQLEIAAATAATAEKLTRYRAYLAAFDDLKVLRDRLTFATALATAWPTVLENLPTDFEKALPQGITAVRACLLEGCLAREAVRLIPKAVEAARRKVTEAEAAISAFESEFGFQPPTTTAPAAAAPEAAPEPPPARSRHAFREPI